MAYVNSKSEVTASVSNGFGAKVEVVYEYGNTAKVRVQVPGDEASIEVDADELDEFITGLRKVHRAMTGSD